VIFVAYVITGVVRRQRQKPSEISHVGLADQLRADSDACARSKIYRAQTPRRGKDTATSIGKSPVHVTRRGQDERDEAKEIHMRMFWSCFGDVLGGCV
jgi:hypothetical protein